MAVMISRVPDAEGPEDSAHRVRVLHIAPAADLALRKVTSPILRRFGDDAFAAFRSLLDRPQDLSADRRKACLVPS
jgi:hypothetical protein